MAAWRPCSTLLRLRRLPLHAPLHVTSHTPLHPAGWDSLLRFYLSPSLPPACCFSFVHPWRCHACWTRHRLHLTKGARAIFICATGKSTLMRKLPTASRYWKFLTPAAHPLCWTRPTLGCLFAASLLMARNFWLFRRTEKRDLFRSGLWIWHQGRCKVWMGLSVMTSPGRPAEKSFFPRIKMFSCPMQTGPISANFFPLRVPSRTWFSLRIARACVSLSATGRSTRSHFGKHKRAAQVFIRF